MYFAAMAGMVWRSMTYIINHGAWRYGDVKYQHYSLYREYILANEILYLHEIYRQYSCHLYFSLSAVKMLGKNLV